MICHFKRNSLYKKLNIQNSARPATKLILVTCLYVCLYIYIYIYIYINNLIEVYEDFSLPESFYFCYQREFGTCNRFSFFNILNLNKLIKYFIDASISKITSKCWAVPSPCSLLQGYPLPSWVRFSLIIRDSSPTFLGRWCQLR